MKNLGWLLFFIIIGLAAQFRLSAAFAEDFNVRLEMPAHCFAPGDLCSLDAYIINHSGSHRFSPLVVLLDIGNGTDYWFWPSWCHYPPDFDYYMAELPDTPDEAGFDVIPQFYWPDITGQMTGLWFWSAVLSSDLTQLASNIAS